MKALPQGFFFRSEFNGYDSSRCPPIRSFFCFDFLLLSFLCFCHDIFWGNVCVNVLHFRIVSVSRGCQNLRV